MPTARDKINNTKKALTDANLLRFPSSEAAYYSQFSFVQYSRSNPKLRSNAVSSSADIIMPLPFNLKEQYSINYSGSEFSWIEGGIRTFEDIVANGGSVNGLDGNDRQIAEQVLQGFARSTFKNTAVVQSIDRFTGSVVNPHMVNIFQNTTLRTHNFNWQLSPTSQQEALALQNIVATFRERMHPTLRSNFILGFPDEVYVTFYGSSFFYPVFKSVVQDVQVDYTDGRPNAWFIDGSPVTITLNITLQEVETLTREDFNGELATTTGTQTTGVTNGN